jgi:hypothetical protein
MLQRELPLPLTEWKDLAADDIRLTVLAIRHEICHSNVVLSLRLAYEEDLSEIFVRRLARGSAH